MTPDQIVTSELLAGLTKCPVCGEGIYHRESNGNIIFQCGSLYAVGRTVKYGQTSNCPLRARVKELEEALKPFTEVKTMRNDEFGFCAHCNHPPSVEEHGWCTEDPKDHTPDCYWIKARNLLEKGSKP